MGVVGVIGMAGQTRFFDSRIIIVNLKYPDIIASITNDLQEESLIHNLRYRTILDIKFVIGVDNPFVMFKDL